MIILKWKANNLSTNEYRDSRDSRPRVEEVGDIVTGTNIAYKLVQKPIAAANCGFELMHDAADEQGDGTTTEPQQVAITSLESELSADAQIPLRSNDAYLKSAKPQNQENYSDDEYDYIY